MLGLKPKGTRLLVKWIAASGSVRALDLHDPLLLLTNRQVFMLVGGIEIAVGTYALFGRLQRYQLIVLAWLSTNFLIYRLARWVGDLGLPCGCLGNIANWLHLSPNWIDLMMKYVLAYMFIGSYALLIQHWIRARQTDGSEPLAEQIHSNVEET